MAPAQKSSRSGFIGYVGLGSFWQAGMSRLAVPVITSNKQTGSLKRCRLGKWHAALETSLRQKTLQRLDGVFPPVPVDPFVRRVPNPREPLLTSSS